MKVVIEKRLETLQDLRLAKETLRKKAKKQEAMLVARSEALYAELSPKRLYDETLDSFDVNNLMMQLLPYALKYKEELLNNPITEKLGKINKKHLPYVAGAAAILGAMAYSYFNNSSSQDVDSDSELKE